MTETIFSIVPIEVWADKRLTLEQMRVLGALLSFRAKNTDTVWPKREQIAERCGMHITNISTATTALCNLGWLVKDGSGGNGRATRYKITVPDLETVAEQATVTPSKTTSQTVAQSATVAERATVADSATLPPNTVADSATTTVADSARGIEQTIEHTNKGNRQDACAMLAGLGVSKTVAADFLQLRKLKKSPLTETALAGIQREAQRAGYSLDDALRTCCERGWAGFKAEWVTDRGGGVAGKPVSKQAQLEARNAEAARRALERFGG